MFARMLSKSFFLLISLVIISCVIYPLILWAIGQIVFPFQANGSLIYDKNHQLVGSKLIAQSFMKDEYFQPRPSAANYDASASSSSALAPSNYALRDRIARALGPIVKYQDGRPVQSDIETWFKQDKFQGNKGIVAQWAGLHNSLAQAWVNADPTHGAFVDNWAKKHALVVKEFIKNNPSTLQPKAADLAVVFFQNFSQENPGKFPLGTSADIQSTFFDMWSQDHPDVVLQDVPGDLVTTSGSGLDPHISLSNAEYQLDRVAAKWAQNLKRNPDEVKKEIEQILQANASAPFWGLTGDKFVNVLDVNLRLQEKYQSMAG